MGAVYSGALLVSTRHVIPERSVTKADNRTWRRLTEIERRTLEDNGNRADDWDAVLVTDLFDPERVRSSSFRGAVRIGAVRAIEIAHAGRAWSVGIDQCRLVDCEIGDDCVLERVRYLARYVVEDGCIVSDVDEMLSTETSRFGNGIIGEAEDEARRDWIAVVNETGSRAVLAFDGMIPADACLWARFRDDERLQARLVEMTQREFGARAGSYGVVGSHSVVRSTRIVRDVAFGECCVVEGAAALRNLTIRSSREEPTRIGDLAVVESGIVGRGSRISHGSFATSFVLGDHCTVEYGSRVAHSVIGDNSTVGGCEVQHSLLFPSHEQHHNNSFLIAALIEGQSNVAAGATIGSNHNSRANDGEVVAGRGFWPGLSTSLKHSSRFASFVLVAKGAYPAEMVVPLPFSLVHNNETDGTLEVMPAYWWLYNMYALARNSWKFPNRDRRVAERQHIEFDYLAPDTAEEIIRARRLLSEWRAAAEGSRIVANGVEKSRRPVVILKPEQGDRAYEEMLIRYGVRNVLQHLHDHAGSRIADVLMGATGLGGQRTVGWTNLGGQITSENDLRSLREEIAGAEVSTWDEVHRRYDEWWDGYALEKQRHAYRVLCCLSGVDRLSVASWIDCLERARRIEERVRDAVIESREKDFRDPFRRATYLRSEEMEAALGSVEDDGFVRNVRDEAARVTALMDTRVREAREVAKE